LLRPAARPVAGHLSRAGVSQESVQLHGGIGMAQETPVGRYFKRLLTLPLLFGDEDAAALSLSARAAAPPPSSALLIPVAVTRARHHDACARTQRPERWTSAAGRVTNSI
jgi:hypothetical protein